MDDLCVFTTGADQLLIDSGKRVGIEVHNYECAPWPGYVTGKLKRGVEFLQTRTERYAMWVDGRDSLILRSAADILNRFRFICDEVDESEILIASEHNCWPDPFAARYYGDFHRRYRSFINAGGFIGRRGRLLGTMQQVAECVEDGDEDDQRAWTTAYIRHFATIGLSIDSGRRVFCSEGDGDTETYSPCTRHWNGRVPGREEFWAKLNA